MRPGRMDRRIIVEELATRQDDYGAPTEAWVVAFECAAEVQWLGGSERFASEQVYAEETVKFRIRYHKDFLPSAKSHRIRYRNTPAVEERLYNITGIAELGRREGWEITAEVRVE